MDRVSERLPSTTTELQLHRVVCNIPSLGQESSEKEQKKPSCQLGITSTLEILGVTKVGWNNPQRVYNSYITQFL